MVEEKDGGFVALIYAMAQSGRHEMQAQSDNFMRAYLCRPAGTLPRLSLSPSRPAPRRSKHGPSPSRIECLASEAAEKWGVGRYFGTGAVAPRACKYPLLLRNTPYSVPRPCHPAACLLCLIRRLAAGAPMAPRLACAQYYQEPALSRYSLAPPQATLQPHLS